MNWWTVTINGRLVAGFADHEVARAVAMAGVDETGWWAVTYRQRAEPC